jgi:hypothetical protein
LSETESKYAQDPDVVVLDAVLVVDDAEGDGFAQASALLAFPVEFTVEVEMIPAPTKTD